MVYAKPMNQILCGPQLSLEAGIQLGQRADLAGHLTKLF